MGGGGGVRSVGVVRFGGQGGCERRIEVFCEKKYRVGGSGWGGGGGKRRCEQRSEVFVKIQKKIVGGGGVGSGGVGLGGYMVDVNEELKFL